MQSCLREVVEAKAPDELHLKIATEPMVFRQNQSKVVVKETAI